MVAAVASSSSSSSQSSSTPLPPYYPSSPSLRGLIFIRDAPPYGSTQAPPQVQTAGVGGGGNGKISPAVLFIIVILAVIFFISGLLHLLVRILMRKQHGGRGAAAAMGESAPSPHRSTGARDAAMDRQLQQLFHLHDSGLDQAFIDALPVFAYREVIGGSKEPFDCAVCLCEFDAEDRLRLLPVCGHAFHLQCIDTWLLSNSTCPLCRGTLFVPGMTIDNLLFDDFDERLEEEPLPEECEDGHRVSRHKPMDEGQPVAEKRVFPVRLGKFKNVGNQGPIGGGVVANGNEAGIVSREAGESSSSSLDARRCFSMGTYQYVLGASELRVALQTGNSRNGASSRFKGRVAGLNSVNADIMDGKRICARSKGESFSVSKIWQWSNVKGKLPAPPDTCSDTGSLPWMKRNSVGDKSNM